MRAIRKSVDNLEKNMKELRESIDESNKVRREGLADLRVAVGRLEQGLGRLEKAV